MNLIKPMYDAVRKKLLYWSGSKYENVEVIGGDGIPEAPNDNKLYGCKNAAWSEVAGTGGTSDFEQLSNRPKYNGAVMTGSTDIPAVPNTADFATATQGQKADTAYQKPATGVPKSDLAADVQTSIGKADSALQSYMETDPTVSAWAKAASKPSYAADKISGLADVSTSGSYDDLIDKPTIPDISGKQDKPATATSGDIAVFDGNKNTVDSGKTFATSISASDGDNKTPTNKAVHDFVASALGDGIRGGAQGAFDFFGSTAEVTALTSAQVAAMLPNGIIVTVKPDPTAIAVAIAYDGTIDNVTSVSKHWFNGSVWVSAGTVAPTPINGDYVYAQNLLDEPLPSQSDAYYFGRATYFNDGTNPPYFTEIPDREQAPDETTLTTNANGSMGIKDGGVGAAKIADGAVTDAKIGNRTLVDNAGSETLTPIAAKSITAWLQGLRDNIKYLLATLAAHLSATNNPHSVTKTQVGLGNVDNTADADKPVSTAQQTALNAKADASDLAAHTDNADIHVTSTAKQTWNNKQASNLMMMDTAASTALPETGTSVTISSVLDSMRRNLKALFSYFTNGVANAAAKLNTARTIALMGNVTGSTTFDGSANAAITATIVGGLKTVNGNSLIGSGNVNVGGSTWVRGSTPTANTNLTAYLQANGCGTVVAPPFRVVTDSISTEQQTYLFNGDTKPTEFISDLATGWKAFIIDWQQDLANGWGIATITTTSNATNSNMGSVWAVRVNINSTVSATNRWVKLNN
jgi:hypothetical protein